MRDVREKRVKNEPTIPSTIGLEKKTNPFVRATSPALQKTLGLVGADPVTVLAETRKRKDSF
jgi:hydroxyacylglutathione hydrolase